MAFWGRNSYIVESDIFNFILLMQNKMFSINFVRITTSGCYLFLNLSMNMLNEKTENNKTDAPIAASYKL
jgi:hypothetical protein